MPTTSPPGALIFDWDGTLISSGNLIFHCLKETLNYMGATEPLKELPAISTKDFFALHFQGRSPEAEGYYYTLIRSQHLEHLVQQEGAIELLSFLKEQQIPLFILSNKRGELLRQEVQQLGWGGFFENVVGSCDAPRDKPSSLAVDFTLKTSSLVAGPEIWFVGDTSVDMECALQSGCTPVLITNNSLEMGNFSIFPPKIKTKNCLDLKNILHRVLCKKE